MKNDPADFPFGPEPGWVGQFTRAQEPGAIPNGSPVVKGESDEGDAHEAGAPGVVLGSFCHPEILDGALCYFVEWADRPRVACAVMGWKIKRPEGVT